MKDNLIESIIEHWYNHPDTESKAQHGDFWNLLHDRLPEYVYCTKCNRKHLKKEDDFVQLNERHIEEIFEYLYMIGWWNVVVLDSMGECAEAMNWNERIIKRLQYNKKHNINQGDENGT